jgi:Raf kinase inhibitor-like YbhB/YbcL family protein
LAFASALYNMMFLIDSGQGRRSAVVLEKIPIELGQALKGQRAGMQNIVYHRLLAIRRVPRIGVHSPAFGNMERMPTRYCGDAEGISPPLEWYGIPDGTASVAVLVEDGDAPTPQPLVHAIAINLDPDLRILGECALMISDDDLPTEVDLGLNSMLKRGWLPPDPPPGHGEHRYAFQVFALAHGPLLPSAAGRHEVLEAILGRGLAAGCLIGTYERPLRVCTKESASDDDAGSHQLTPDLG